MSGAPSADSRADLLWDFVLGTATLDDTVLAQRLRQDDETLTAAEEVIALGPELLASLGWPARAVEAGMRRVLAVCDAAARVHAERAEEILAQVAVDPATSERLWDFILAGEGAPELEWVQRHLHDSDDASEAVAELGAAGPEMIAALGLAPEAAERAMARLDLLLDAAARMHEDAATALVAEATAAREATASEEARAEGAATPAAAAGPGLLERLHRWLEEWRGGVWLGAAALVAAGILLMPTPAPPTVAPEALTAAIEPAIAQRTFDGEVPMKTCAVGFLRAVLAEAHQSTAGWAAPVSLVEAVGADERCSAPGADPGCDTGAALFDAYRAVSTLSASDTGEWLASRSGAQVLDLMTSAMCDAPHRQEQCQRLTSISAQSPRPVAQTDHRWLAKFIAWFAVASCV